MSVKELMKDIDDATLDYVSALHDYEIHTLIPSLIPRKFEKRVHIFQYPGIADDLYLITKACERLKKPKDKLDFIKKRFKKNNSFKGWNPKKADDNKFWVGIFAITFEKCKKDEEVEAHYMSIYRTPKSKEIWLWDSAYEGKKEEGYYIIKTLFPSFEIKPLRMCQGCFQKGAGAGELGVLTENVFCHTWSLWFYYFVFSKIKLNDFKTFTKGIEQLNNICHKGKDELNLVVIKIFARDYVSYVLEYVPYDDFDLYYVISKNSAFVDFKNIDNFKIPKLLLN